MPRLRIAIIFGSVPNFDAYAFKYFILSLNKLQNTYEIMFPDLHTYPFKEKIIDFNTSHAKVANAMEGHHYDYTISIITSRFNNNYFFNAGDKSAVITTEAWDKFFCPPSLFEFLLHSIYCCLIFSQKTLPNRNVSQEAIELEINSHRDTKGCVADFTRNKHDDRVDIISGYICDQHQQEIILLYGEEYLNETKAILERKWIGTIEEKGSVAYNLKHVFKFDIEKQSGFNKNFFEKACEKFYEIPYELASEILKLIITVLLTYLLLKLGLPAD